MKPVYHFIFLTVLVTSVLVPLHGNASSEKKAVEKQPRQQSAPAEKPQTRLVPYIPPKPLRPTPKIRTSQGGTRGCGGLPAVTLLAPEHVALTAQEQPQLYWHISPAADAPMVFTLSSDDAAEPLLELRLPESTDPGVYFISIADHDVHLQTGKIYEWSVRMLCEQEKSGSGDLVVKSYIKRVPADERLLVARQSDDPMTRARGYAHNGIWYDAVAVLYQALTDSVDNQKLKSAWRDLLGQVELPTH